MIIRNRELSQFGSFVYVENSNKNVGIATTPTPYVGIGTTDATHKLTVVGNSKFNGDVDATGIVSSTGYFLNGTPLINAATSPWIVDFPNVYRLEGNVGVGTSSITERLEVIGNVKANTFISTVTNGTSPFTVTSQTLVTNLNADYLRGKVAPSGDIVGTTDVQTLSNKNIDLATSNLTGTLSQFNTALSDDNFVSLTGTETLTNKTLTSPTISSILNSGAKSIPTGIGTFVITGSTGTVTSGMIADGTIVNADISASAAIDVSKLAASTISGISLGSNLNSLTAGSYITYNSGTTYNGSAARTISVNGSSSNTANSLVARNASGDFTAGSITCTNLTASTAVTVNGTNLLTTINQKASTGKAIAMAMIFG